MDEEKLISLVSCYPELYDIENNHYMNQTRKNNIWIEISSELGIDDVTCKEKWKGLRDAYHRCLKRRKFKSGDGAKNLKKWRYESQMSFLRPYFQERITKTNITNPIINDDENISNPDTPASSSSVPINSPRPVSRATSTPDLDTAPSPSASNSSQKTKSTVFKSLTGRKKNNQQYAGTVANVLERYLNNQAISRSSEPTSSIHSFFKAMADTVVALPPNIQIKVKNQVYSIVSQAEFENLRQTSVSPVYTECDRIPDINLPQQQQPDNNIQSNFSGSVSHVTQEYQPSQNITMQIMELHTPISNESEPTPSHRSGQIKLNCTMKGNLSGDMAEASANIQECQSFQSTSPPPAQFQYRYYIDSNGKVTYEKYPKSV